jgi:CRISPR system Cascade subunit CasC
MTPRTYVDVHVLQTVPPSNLNRDDAGSPKQAVYGGVRRARVSSQAWKRATRKAFTEKLHMPAEQLGTRTKRISSLLAGRLAARTSLDREAATRLSTHLLKDLKVSPGKKESDTAYLLFFGHAQLDTIVDLVAGNAGGLAALDDKALDAALADLPVREQLGTGHPVDVALFGRMIADLPLLNVDAATQVAHALSTHAAEVEFDYYTAVDDEKDTREEDAGAAMIGTVEFTSATLYRYATVGVHQLAANLGGDVEATAGALAAFVRAFVTSMPTGHRNTFAHQTVPSLVAVMVRDDQPVNLVSAFESAVRGDGLAAQSAVALAREAVKVRDAWGLTPLRTASQYAVPAAETDAATLADAFGPPVPFADVVGAAEIAARERLAEVTV